MQDFDDFIDSLLRIAHVEMATGAPTGGAAAPPAKPAAGVPPKAPAPAKSTSTSTSTAESGEKGGLLLNPTDQKTVVEILSKYVSCLLDIDCLMSVFARVGNTQFPSV